MVIDNNCTNSEIRYLDSIIKQLITLMVGLASIVSFWIGYLYIKNLIINYNQVSA